ncbi:putative ATPase/DNA-binding SARP family transcriptional activator [Cellulosimicrobium cellulans]|uniref:AfsR/SARP family transcriptional regulator n=1 Tax=Cellulosimicrobium cellulans TaxID=1710 RepID=UPI00195A9C7D|nr:BTAD domain-containing putative transcriptional regulator [Cellulosimicrobium cellulans]MBM7819691.1 putative ATPase/DNA-binding SARP family transcriptional activator [Cellulosimicrobium cellulans]
MPAPDAPTPPGDALVRVLGPVRVPGSDGTPVAPRGSRAAALVVALALAGGRTLGVATLVEDLWGLDAPQDPRAALQSLVSRLRRDTASGTVLSRAGGYALGVPSDLDRARSALADARSGAHRGSGAGSQDGTGNVADLRGALALWHDEDPGADVPGPVGQALRVEATRLHDGLTVALRSAAAAAGDRETVVALATAALDRDETDEDAARDLMTALAASGREREALAAYARVRHALVRELGTDPAPDLQRLAADLLDRPPGAGDPARSPARDGEADALAAASGAGTRPATGRATGGRATQVRGVRAAPDALVGRDDDVDRVRDALARTRLVTVLGPGGLGKTRLAQEVARRAAATGTVDLVVVVELAGVRSDEDVVVALADGLGISPPGRTGRLADRLAAPELREQVLDRVRGRDVLLVLDNCEHVLDGAAAWTADLLGAAPHLAVLTTSRSPLRLAAEHVYPLDALGADGGTGPAVRLFVERARAVRPGASLPPAVVAQLCERLDGLPLAIELAAARVRTMSVEDVERHLDERFALLRSGDRLAPDRHRTLEAVIEWSWNLLGETEQDLLCRAAVFPDGFSAEAAQAVAGDALPGAVLGAPAWGTLDALDGLVAQSLLRVVEDDGVVRYRMLETVREFGALRLQDAGATAAAREAVQRWAAALAARCADALAGGDQTAAATDLRREQENLLFALREAVQDGRPDVVVRVFAALMGSWLLLGIEDQAAGLVEVVLDSVVGWEVPPEDVQPAALALAAVAGAGAFARPELAARALGRLRRILRRPDVGPRTRAFARLLTVRSAEEMESTLASLRADDDAFVAMLAEFTTAQMAENEGRLAEARSWGALAHERAVARGDVAARATTAMFLASCASEAGDAADVGRWAEAARDHLRALGATATLQQLDWVEMSAAVTLGETERAERMLAAFDGTVGGAGFGTADVPPDVRSVVAMGRAEVAAMHGDDDAALALYGEAAASFDDEARWSPWYVLLVSSWLVRLATAGSALTPTVADELRSLVLGMHRARPHFVDYPVVGTSFLALGVGSVLGAGGTPGGASDAVVERGALLVALAERMGSRQDQPSLRHENAWAQVTAVAGAAVAERARTEVRDLERGDLARRGFALLDEAEGDAGRDGSHDA